MQERVTFITGSSRGIGLHLAQSLVATGQIVYGCSRSESTWTHPNYNHYPGDIRDDRFIRGVVRQIRKDCGKLDHLINNAGVASLNHLLLTPNETVDYLFDINFKGTLFYSLSSGGTLVVPNKRDTETVCELIAKYSVQVLPASPTFLGLMLMNDVFSRYDLKSLESVTYGTEVMPMVTLERFNKKLPHVRLLQTYGLSELGILRARSEASNSLWVKIGGDGYETRVREGLLELKSKTAMIGYLNAPSPFTDDGWFKTGDAVKVKGDYFQILGRKSDIINVGGEKVGEAGKT